MNSYRYRPEHTYPPCHMLHTYIDEIRCYTYVWRWHFAVRSHCQKVMAAWRLHLRSTEKQAKWFWRDRAFHDDDGVICDTTVTRDLTPLTLSWPCVDVVTTIERYCWNSTCWLTAMSRSLVMTADHWEEKTPMVQSPNNVVQRMHFRHQHRVTN